ncbi:MAG TPA: hypothetical protein VLC12_09160 [Terriglobales bacterium]|nr:hypothetical protein [Terriglobales bacterium]
MLIASLVLAIAPLLGIAYIVAQGSFDTVDNLFYVLILLAMSGIFAANAWVEMGRRRRVRGLPRATAAGRAHFAAAAAGRYTERGLVEDVLFFESPIGYPDKSIVTLRSNRGPARLLFFEGDLRNQLPTGHQVEVTYETQDGAHRMLALSYK